METESGFPAAIRFDIVDALGRDSNAGGLRELAHYLERFPGHEDLVAREYRLWKQSPASHDAGQEAPGPEGSRSPGGIAATASGPDLDTLRERVRRLSQPVPKGARYSREAEIGRGGMGVVHRVRDRELDRTLALKVMRGDASLGRPLHAARFLEEAQVTAQLDHPGIVPVHEVGVDDEGHLFFAMKLVRGRELRTILDQLQRGEDGWTLPRVLTVLLKVCDAMAYSHSKGAIHRDLKPSNIMVGNFGEVYVMDWGLARVLGRPDLHDLRIQEATRTASLKSVRGHHAEGDDPSPLLTRDGEIVGTPSYMSPEQARGELDQLSPRTDVYSVGAILYHALTGQAPFVPTEAKVSPQSVLWRLIEGPPTPVPKLRPGIPRELVAICEKAMARDTKQRYPDMSALAKDLSAFMEQRVVEAYETGAWAEARKWVRRNKVLATTLAASLVLALGGTGSVGYVQAAERRVAERERERADAKALEAQQNLTLSEEYRHRAETETAKVLRLSDVKVLQEMVAEVDSLWPPHPDRIAALESWLSRARKLADNLDVHRATLSEMRAGAGGTPESDVPAVAWRFDSPEDQWQHDVLAQLIRDLEELEQGLLAPEAIVAGHGWSVPKRLAFALQLEADFAPGGWCAEAWTEALPAIEAAYPGIDLPPQVGLLPLGPDPSSGLWEFAHLQTGEPALRDEQGKLILSEATGLVLVLLPGGTFSMGAQSADPIAANFDPHAGVHEVPAQAITLSPFFASKYEMAQGQWLRSTGTNPSGYKPPNPLVRSLLHPVEQVSWTVCVETCAHLGLSLPSEAQWEYAARGGTSSIWWSGDDPSSLYGTLNMADQAAVLQAAPWGAYSDLPDWNDGYVVHAPVDRYDPNPFGLHNVLGNVWELCGDGYQTYYHKTKRPIDPIVDPGSFAARPARGGCFADPTTKARIAVREGLAPGSADNTVGFRPCRAITR